MLYRVLYREHIYTYVCWLYMSDMNQTYRSINCMTSWNELYMLSYQYYFLAAGQQQRPLLQFLVLHASTIFVHLQGDKEQQNECLPHS